MLAFSDKLPDRIVEAMSSVSYFWVGTGLVQSVNDWLLAERLGWIPGRRNTFSLQVHIKSSPAA